MVFQRTPWIIGNWKMYKTHLEAEQFIECFKQLAKEGFKEKIVGLLPPFTAISSALKAAQGTSLIIGAQNFHEAKEGAFTGEVSLGMLKAFGVRHILIGHSERRAFFGETDITVNRKLKEALAQAFTPILCIGETLADRESGKTALVLEAQLERAFQDIFFQELTSLVIAYEPIWAIGTGKSATPQEAQEVHERCREWLTGKSSAAMASKIPILYGGSVKPETMASLMGEKDIDGVLVGGASLDPESFFKIVSF